MTDLDLTATTPADMERLLNSLRSSHLVRERGGVSAQAQLYRLRTGARPAGRAGADRRLSRRQSRAQPRTDGECPGVPGPADRRLRAPAGRRREAPGDLQAGAPEHPARARRTTSFRPSSCATSSPRPRRASRARRRFRRACAASSKPGLRQTRPCRSSRPSRRSTQLLINYTERHPDVIALRRKLASLRGGAGTPVDGKPAGQRANGDRARASLPLVDYEQVKSQLGEADAQAAVYSGRVDSLRARLAPDGGARGPDSGRRSRVRQAHARLRRAQGQARRAARPPRAGQACAGERSRHRPDSVPDRRSRRACRWRRMGRRAAF